jgi:peptide/nickel transport system substrate-binding protein
VYEYPGLRALLIQPSLRKGSNEFITDNAGKPLAENPLTDQRVREALNIAINRKAITDRILQGTATEANQWMPKGSFGYNPDIPATPYSAEKAK